MTAVAAAEPGAFEAPDPRFARPGLLFFGVGAQKAGTTWIDRWLRADPEVCLPVRKELHYWTSLRPPHLSGRLQRAEAELKRIAARGALRNTFRSRQGRERDAAWGLCAEMLRAPAPGHARYADALFQSWRGQRVAGEITPAYALLGAETYAEMAALAGDVRFFFVMRDPYARLVSGLRRDLRKRHGPEGVTAERLAARAVQALDDPEGLDVARSRYDRTVRALDAGAGPERAAYFFYETLFDQAEVDRLARHLTLAPRAAPVEKVVNRGKDGGEAVLPEGLEARARAALAPVYAFVRTRFGALPPGWSPGPAEG